MNVKLPSCLHRPWYSLWRRRITRRPSTQIIGSCVSFLLKHCSWSPSSWPPLAHSVALWARTRWSIHIPHRVTVPLCGILNTKDVHTVHTIQHTKGSDLPDLTCRNPVQQNWTAATTDMLSSLLSTSRNHLTRGYRHIDPIYCDLLTSGQQIIKHFEERNCRC